MAQTTMPEDASGFRLYGQINRGFLSYDDGSKTFNIPFVQGSKSAGRIGLEYSRPMDNGWTFFGIGEFGATYRETDRINQLDPYDDRWEFDQRVLRKLEVIFKHPDRGTFYIGQGAMSGSDAASQDLSLTNVVSGASVRGIAGGMFFRRSDGTLSTIRIKDRFRTLGFSRTLRLRYDTPVRNGLKFGISAGKEVLDERDGRYYADLSSHYDITRGDYRFKAAAALRWAGGNPDTKFQQESVNFVVSGSLLHKPSRYNLTGTFGVDKDGAYFAYAKFGRRWYKWLPYGWTAASIDYYFTEGSNSTPFRGNSIGLSIVQKFKRQNFDIYATLRQYRYNDPTANYKDSLAFLTGIRWQF